MSEIVAHTRRTYIFPQTYLHTYYQKQDGMHIDISRKMYVNTYNVKAFRTNRKILTKQFCNTTIKHLSINSHEWRLPATIKTVKRLMQAWRMYVHMYVYLGVHMERAEAETNNREKYFMQCSQ